MNKEYYINAYKNKESFNLKSIIEFQKPFREWVKNTFPDSKEVTEHNMGCGTMVFEIQGYIFWATHYPDVKLINFLLYGEIKGGLVTISEPADVGKLICEDKNKKQESKP